MKKLLTLAVALLTACAVEKATISAFTDPTFQAGQVHSIAIFPIRNARLAPSESQEISRKISSDIAGNRPDLSIIGPSATIEKLNAAGLASDWARFLDQYLSSGIPNSTLLGTIAVALNVDAILQGEVVSVQQADGTFGKTFGSTRVTVRMSMLDPKKGKLLWEATSDGILETSDTISDAPPVNEAINLAIGKLSKALPPL